MSGFYVIVLTFKNMTSIQAAITDLIGIVYLFDVDTKLFQYLNSLKTLCDEAKLEYEFLNRH